MSIMPAIREIRRYRMHLTVAIISLVTITFFQNCSSGFKSVAGVSAEASTSYSHSGSNGGTPPIVSFTLSATNVAPGANVTIYVTAAAQSSGATIKQVDIFVGGNDIKTLMSSPYNYTISESTAGPYSIYVSATDSMGGVTQTGSQTLTVMSSSGGGGSGCLASNYQAPVWSSGQQSTYSYNIDLSNQIDTSNLVINNLAFSSEYTVTNIMTKSNDKNITVTANASKRMLTISPSNGVECASGTAIITAQLQDQCSTLPGFQYPASSTKTFTINYHNTCPSQTVLTQSAPAYQEAMGSQVATDGSVVVMTAPQYSGNGQKNSGAAYIFSASTGQQLTMLTPSSVADQKIDSVAIRNGTIVLGTYPLPGVSGAVYVFKGSGSNWALATTIQQPSVSGQSGLDPLDFGASVAILSDGSIVVGAPGEDVNGLYEAGAVYIFSGSNYSQIAHLTAKAPVQFETFGASLDASGTTLAVGAPYASYQESLSTTAIGSAYVFSGSSGSSLTQTARALLMSTKANASDVYQFGASVSISGSELLVGAPEANGGGMAYLFNTTGKYVGAVAETSKGSSSGDKFGQSVQVDASTNTLWVGAPALSSDTGAIFKFSIGSSTPSYMLTSENLANQPLYSTTGGQFGASFVVNGANMAIGSPGFAGLVNGSPTIVNSGIGFVMSTP